VIGIHVCPRRPTFAQLASPPRTARSIRNCVDWWDGEAEMRAAARARFPAIGNLADRGFDLVQNASTGVLAGKWQFWEGILALNIAQADNTAACAWEAAYAGYYMQSGALMRLLTEYLAVVWYLPNHQEAAHKWNDISKRPPEAGSLLKKVFESDPDTNDRFSSLRKDVFHRMAHQDSVGLRSIVGESDDPLTIVINSRGRFHPKEFEYTARLLLPLHASVPLAINLWRGDQDHEWRDDALQYRADVVTWIDEWEKRNPELLDQNDSVRDPHDPGGVHLEADADDDVARSEY
jgi:hypothetical protein